MSYIARLPTPTFTATPTPTNTPTPTIPPTITPTSFPGGVYILNNHSSYQKPYGGYCVVGEVLNNTPDYLTLVKVSVKFYDAQDRLVDTDYNYLHFDLSPNERNCFSVCSYSSGLDWEYYRFDPVDYRISDSEYPLVTLFGLNGYVYNDWYFVLGESRNDNSFSIDRVRVKATLFDSSNIVVDCGWQYTNIDTLDPGQTSAFEIQFDDRELGYEDVNNYTVKFYAERQ
jgi:hypothetical protein